MTKVGTSLAVSLLLMFLAACRDPAGGRLWVQNNSDQPVGIWKIYNQPPVSYDQWQVDPNSQALLTTGNASTWPVEVFDTVTCRVLAGWVGDDNDIGVVVGLDESVSFLAGLSRVPPAFSSIAGVDEFPRHSSSCKPSLASPTP